MKKSLIIFLPLLLFFMTGCNESQINTYDRDFFAMDTYITCQVAVDDPKLAEAGLGAIENAYLEIDRITNRFVSNSEISMVNSKAGLEPVKVSKELYAIVETALIWSDKTEGAFNILLGSIMDLWGFGSDNHRVPAEEELAAALTLTDYHKIILDKEETTIFLPEKGMVLDLGGIAKGYATDKAVAALEELGIKNALINAGGNVYALGKKADGTDWNIGVQDPRDPQGIAAVLNASDSALISSGDYQRYFEVDGVRYHHILDPANGYPARASAGTTIIMKSATVADILSTAVFVKGPEEGIKLAEGLSQVDAAMVITGDGEVHGTQALKNYMAEH